MQKDRLVCVLLPNLFFSSTAVAAKSLQSCPTLCDFIDGSPPGSAVPGILQARTLEWVAISFSNAWKWKVKLKLLSCVRLFATPRTAAYQALPSMGFARQGYWSGLPLPSLRLHVLKFLFPPHPYACPQILRVQTWPGYYWRNTCWIADNTFRFMTG